MVHQLVPGLTIGQFLTDVFTGAGYDNIHVQACTSRSIRVSHVPGTVNDATADTTMFLILGALRGFNRSMVALRNGDWRGTPPPPLGHDPQDKILGILGMGGIGRNLAKKAQAFGMNIQYHNRTRLNEKSSGGFKYVSFEELLSTSDVLSLNLPLNVSHNIALVEKAALELADEVDADLRNHRIPRAISSRRANFR